MYIATIVMVLSIDDSYIIPLAIPVLRQLHS